MLKAILIDIDNTLLDFHRCAEYAMKRAFNDYGLEYKPEYLPIFLEENDYYWGLFEDGKIAREDIFKERFKNVFKRIGLDLDGEAFERRYLHYMYQSHAKVDGAEELLAYLSKKYPVYAASNAVYEEQSGRLEKAGLREYFCALFTSEDIGYAKPDQAFFDYIVEQIGLDKSEVIMIGDSIRTDILGGKNAGIKTLWYNPRNEPANELADITVSSLEEIKEIV